MNTTDALAFRLYRELHGLPWWRLSLTEREKREARETYRRLKVWMTITREVA